MTFESAGKIYYAGASFMGILPVPEGELFVARKEDEVDAMEGAGVDALDEGDLVADGFEGA